MPEQTTARKGNPRQASRGAAARRAREDFGNALTDKLTPSFEAMEMALAAHLIGCDIGEVRQRVHTATLEQLEQWTKAVEAK